MLRATVFRLLPMGKADGAKTRRKEEERERKEALAGEAGGEAVYIVGRVIEMRGHADGCAADGDVDALLGQAGEESGRWGCRTSEAEIMRGAKLVGNGGGADSLDQTAGQRAD